MTSSQTELETEEALVSVELQDRQPTETDERKSEKGLTLVELLVVILLLGLIGGGVGMTVIGRFKKARVDIASNKVKELAKAVELFRLENNRLPESLNQLKSKEGNGPYWEDQLQDPWGQDYVFKELGGSDYDIVSFGEDREPGGDGRDADISYQELIQGKDDSGSPF